MVRQGVSTLHRLLNTAFCRRGRQGAPKGGVYFEGVGRHLAIPFGGVDLLLWVLDRLRFGRLMQEVKMPFTIYSVPTMLLRTWSCVPSPAAHY